MSFAHLVIRGSNSIAYLTEILGMHDGIKHILEARLGRIVVRRMLSSFGIRDASLVDNSCTDLESMSVAKEIPSEHSA